MLLTNPTVRNLQWTAGVLENFGALEVISKGKSPTLILRFKTAYLDKLHAICAAIGYDGVPTGPHAPSGHSKQPQYELILRGANLVALRNAVFPLLRTGKKWVIAKREEELQAARKALGLKGPKFCIDPDAVD